ATPTANLSFNGSAAQTIHVERTTTTSNNGSSLTIQAGGAPSGALDKNGGDLVLSGGIATGNGSGVSNNGSTIIFKTATPLGSSSSLDVTPSEKMRICGNGFVGIGGITPAYPLEVGLTTQRTISNYGYLNQSGSTGNISSNQTPDISIRASGRILATEFNAMSDARIKHILNRTNTAADLQTLSSIQVTDYRFIDTIEKGKRTIKKVIAQELEAIYPSAVTKSIGTVPDVFQLAEIKDGIITVANSLQAGDMVKLVFANRTEVIKVLAATGTTIKVDAADTGKVFVYGKQVDDFRSVDYEALTTLNISATQELLKKIQQLDAENNTLKTQLNAKADATEVNQLKLQLDELKLLMQQNGIRTAK
ncbi:MAG TPA: tail fiber domain-containing protein, partial [Chitinophagales bacterium]|nr:tail fiber domain-containing protein [Chitinophagales bacterium]